MTEEDNPHAIIARLSKASAVFDDLAATTNTEALKLDLFRVATLPKMRLSFLVSHSDYINIVIYYFEKHAVR